jgi:arginase
MESDWFINKPVLPIGDKQTRMSAIYQQLSDFVSEIIEIGERPVSIAGDCCTAIGVFSGLQQSGHNPTLIWFDAHGDFNTWETTPSGFLGGMPLAMLVGRGEQTMVDAVKLKPISEANVILTDARDLDQEERELLKESAVQHVSEAINLIEHPLPNDPLYIHVDADIINPDEAPAMNYPAFGGPSSLDLQNIFRYLAQTGQILAVSISSWNPKLDKDGHSQEVCMALLETLINN